MFLGERYFYFIPARPCVAVPAMRGGGCAKVCGFSFLFFCRRRTGQFREHSHLLGRLKREGSAAAFGEQETPVFSRTWRFFSPPFGFCLVLLFSFFLCCAVVFDKKVGFVCQCIGFFCSVSVLFRQCVKGVGGFVCWLSTTSGRRFFRRNVGGFVWRAFASFLLSANSFAQHHRNVSGCLCGASVQAISNGLSALVHVVAGQRCMVAHFCLYVRQFSSRFLLVPVFFVFLHFLLLTLFDVV